MPEQDDNPSCKTCIYCEHDSRFRGLCRIDPPKVRTFADYTDDDALWPNVSLDDDWCGKHQRLSK